MSNIKEILTTNAQCLLYLARHNSNKKDIKFMDIDFEKMNGLVPAIIQDSTTRKVLMLGYMNKEAFDKTMETGRVTFYSRRRKCLWTKGETSGNYLNLVDIKNDCDKDTLLVTVRPEGPVCHFSCPIKQVMLGWDASSIDIAYPFTIIIACIYGTHTYL